MTPRRSAGTDLTGCRRWPSITIRSWLAHGLGSRSRSGHDGRRGHVLNAQLLPLRPGLCLEQIRRRYVDAGTRILHKQDAEALAAEVAGGEEAADVRRQAADSHCGDAAAS